MKRRGIVSKRIPMSQTTLTGETVIQARKLVSLNSIPDMNVYCIFCFHRGKMKDFAIIDVMGELENLWKCPECHIRMTRGTLISYFTPEGLGYFIGYYDRFWGRVQNHELWSQRFKLMFPKYDDRMQFWNAYYKARPKTENRVEDNI